MKTDKLKTHWKLETGNWKLPLVSVLNQFSMKKFPCLIIDTLKTHWKLATGNWKLSSSLKPTLTPNASIASSQANGYGGIS